MSDKAGSADHTRDPWGDGPNMSAWTYAEAVRAGFIDEADVEEGRKLAEQLGGPKAWAVWESDGDKDTLLGAFTDERAAEAYADEYFADPGTTLTVHDGPVYQSDVDRAHQEALVVDARRDFDKAEAAWLASDEPVDAYGDTFDAYVRATERLEEVDPIRSRDEQVARDWDVNVTRPHEKSVAAEMADPELWWDRKKSEVAHVEAEDLDPLTTRHVADSYEYRDLAAEVVTDGGRVLGSDTYWTPQGKGSAANDAAALAHYYGSTNHGTTGHGLTF